MINATSPKGLLALNRIIIFQQNQALYLHTVHFLFIFLFVSLFPLLSLWYISPLPYYPLSFFHYLTLSFIPSLSPLTLSHYSFLFHRAA